MTAGDIVAATAGTMLSGSAETVICEIGTDSRAVNKGMLFIPLAGERFDGHDYIESALNKGAAAVLTHKDLDFKTDKCVIRVGDTLTALGDIARFYKNKYSVPTVAVTGSVGKTTTKDMIYAALASQKKTLKTMENYNNNIGLPKTLFNLNDEHELAVVEMGMNHFGEIDYLASIANPDIAVITNIGMSHIENLGSREGIFKAKTEITRGFTEKNTLIVNGDDDYLKTLKSGAPYKVVTYGISGCDVYAKNITDNGLKGIEFTAVADGAEYAVKVNVPGEHNVYNALAAICVSRELGLDIPKAIAGIENMTLTANRLEIEDINGVTVIKDYYNASPSSVRAALKILSTEKRRRKAAVLGDILEMGEYAKDAHYALGADVMNSGADFLITAGENAKYIADGARDGGMKNVKSFDTTDAAAEAVKREIKDGDVVLIKASHGMKFEKIYNAIRS